MMDYLARRSHTEAELRLKLSENYASDDVEDALSRAREAGWILPAEEMAQQYADELSRKHKGHQFILQALEAKGLPPLPEDFDSEVAKARDLLALKLKHDASDPMPEELSAKAHRLLSSRGFSEDVIGRLLGGFRPE